MAEWCSWLNYCLWQLQFHTGPYPAGSTRHLVVYIQFAIPQSTLLLLSIFLNGCQCYQTIIFLVYLLYQKEKTPFGLQVSRTAGPTEAPMQRNQCGCFGPPALKSGPPSAGLKNGCYYTLFWHQLETVNYHSFACPNKCSRMLANAGRWG